MSKDINKLSILNENMFQLIKRVGENLAVDIDKGNIDPQSIYALTKLIDSFIKLNEVDSSLNGSNKEEAKPNVISKDDEDLLLLYRSKEVAPRAGLEPATKRLTAACSTTELPGND